MGDRRVWLVGALVLVVGIVGIAVALAQPRERLTGSNSVGVRAEVAVVQPGERLCVPEVSVPDGSGVLRIAAGWDGPISPSWRVAVDGSEVRSRGSAPVRRAIADPNLHDRVEIPFDVIDAPGEAATARICVTPVGVAAKIGGTPGLQADQRAATVDGRPLEQRVALWFATAPGDRASLLSRLGDAAERAALFRPGAVGPWLYWVGLLAVVPLLWLAALWLLATRSAGLGRPGRTALAVAAIAFVNAALWALLTPAFQGPDEPEHFAFTQTLAETGTAPEKHEGGKPAFSSRAVVALEGVRTYSQVGLVDARPPWLEADERRWRQRLATTETRADDGGGFLFPASPHGPGYYALTLPAYAAAGGDVFTQLTLTRLVSALLVALAAACAFLTVRELVPRHQWLAVTAGLLVAFQPQFGFIGGTVNSDNGVNAAAALLIYLLVRGLRRGPTVALGAAIGATLVAVHVTKGTGTALFPAALVGIAGMAWRHHARGDLPAYGALAGVAVAIQGLWALLAPSFGTKPFTTPGGAAGAGLAGTVENVAGHLGTFGSYLWQFFVPLRLPFMNDLFVQKWPAYDVYLIGGWAAFGWLTVRFPGWVYVTIAVVGGIALVFAALAVARERLAARARGWEIAVLATALISVPLGVAAVHFVPDVRSVPAEQGRYIFTAIVPLAALAAVATLAFGRRRAPLVAALLVAAVAILSYASQLLTLTTFYA